MHEHVPQETCSAIIQRIEGIEAANTVKVVYACESGSRAWGFASSDSDFDVRFVYVNRPEWYLSIDTRRDVIELPIEGDLDINGWDLKKALGLLRKSNPPLLEWLGSPIVYREVTPIASWMRDYLKIFYSPKACRHHYLQMAEGNFRQYLKGAGVIRKKYLYALRPLVAVLWIEKGLGVVPTLFQTAVDTVVDDPNVRSAVGRLLADKRSGREMAHGPRIPEIDRFLETALNRLKGSRYEAPGKKPPWDKLNRLFRDGIAVAWELDV